MRIISNVFHHRARHTTRFRTMFLNNSRDPLVGHTPACRPLVSRSQETSCRERAIQDATHFVRTVSSASSTTAPLAKPSMHLAFRRTPDEKVPPSAGELRLCWYLVVRCRFHARHWRSRARLIRPLKPNNTRLTVSSLLPSASWPQRKSPSTQIVASRARTSFQRTDTRHEHIILMCPWLSAPTCSMIGKLRDVETSRRAHSYTTLDLSFSSSLEHPRGTPREPSDSPVKSSKFPEYSSLICLFSSTCSPSQDMEVADIFNCHYSKMLSNGFTEYFVRGRFSPNTLSTAKGS